jgi:hypothetical protein
LQELNTAFDERTYDKEPVLSKTTKDEAKGNKVEDSIRHPMNQPPGSHLCGIIGCDVLAHTRIMDLNLNITLEPRSYCCRTLMATITMTAKTLDVLELGPDIFGAGFWYCKAITAEAFVSGCCPPRNTREDSGFDLAITRRMMIFVAVISASCLMLAEDSRNDKDIKCRLFAYAIEQVAVGCVWQWTRYLCYYDQSPSNMFYWLGLEDIYPDMYTRAAIAWVAYEMGDSSKQLSNLIRHPYTDDGEFALKSLVAILNKDDLAEEVAKFRTDNSNIAHELVHTFATKVFYAH